MPPSNAPIVPYGTIGKLEEGDVFAGTFGAKDMKGEMRNRYQLVDLLFTVSLSARIHPWPLGIRRRSDCRLTALVAVCLRLSNVQDARRGRGHVCCGTRGHCQPVAWLNLGVCRGRIRGVRLLYRDGKVRPWSAFWVRL